jgi:hypothetical protein
VLSSYASLRSEFCVVMSVTISAYKRCSVRLYLQLFVRGCMSYLCYLCLLAHSGVLHILCCGFFLVFVLCNLCCQFLWIVHYWLPLRYSLMFVYIEWINECSPYLVTNVKKGIPSLWPKSNIYFTGVYRCCLISIYNIFIKYIVFHYDIH